MKVIIDIGDTFHIDELLCHKGKIVSYKFNENSEHGILEVIMSGDVNIAEAHETRMQTAKLCREHGYKRLLVNVQSTITVASGDTLGLFNLGDKELQEIGMPRDVKVALVLSTESNAAKDWAFLATVEQNRGLGLRKFDDLDKARDWLLMD